MPENAMLGGMGRPSRRTPRKPETDTQATMLARIQEELDRQRLSRAALARLGRMNQKTFNDVMNGAVPHLTMVHKIALGLGVHVADLFRPTQAASADGSLGNKVSTLPVRYPSWSEKIGKQGKLKRKTG